MEFITIIGTILIFASIQTILFKKKIEQTISISVVEIILIVYIFGLFDILMIGVKVIQIISIIFCICMIFFICKQKNKEKVKEIMLNIITPGFVVYVILCIIAIIINKDRIFENSDEFYHWGRIIKNMYLYGTFGTNKESIIVFNDYPPFTAIFQYLFISAKNVYSEDIVIIAHNILYFSFMIQITKNIRWDKSLKKLIMIVPIIIFLPIIFYENFYLEILVDGIIGIVFGLLLYNAQEEESLFKTINIFSLIITLSLIKTTGIALAIVAVFIVLIRNIKNNDKKAIKNILLIILITVGLTSIWYVKISGSHTRWDFSSYIEITQNKNELEIAKKFIRAIFRSRSLTGGEITAIATFIVLICFNFYVMKIKSKKDYKYYSIAMIISIVIYLIGLMFSYMKLFSENEAQILACYSRYCSTIFLAFLTLQLMELMLNEEINIKKILIMVSILLIFVSENNIQNKYFNWGNSITASTISRNVITKLRYYKNELTEDDAVLFITGIYGSEQLLVETNRYEMMPIRIFGYEIGLSQTEEELINLIEKGDYTHVYIYRIEDETKENIKGIFENQYIGKDRLYKISEKNNEIYLEMVRINE